MSERSQIEQNEAKLSLNAEIVQKDPRHRPDPRVQTVIAQDCYAETSSSSPSSS